MDKTSLGDRMKRYEKVSLNSLTRRVPVVIRVDGRSFHSYTKGFNRPFDERIIYSMFNAAIEVAKDMQGFQIGYVQSDEASFLLTDYERLETEPWFGYNLSKIISNAASMMTAYFNKIMQKKLEEEGCELTRGAKESADYPKDIEKHENLKKKIAFFDARAFNIPKEDVVNYFLWRAKDWSRNSIQMYARDNFSQKQLHGKNTSDMHEMLYGIGKNWATDLSSEKKNGTFILNGGGFDFTIKPTYEDIEKRMQGLVI